MTNELKVEMVDLEAQAITLDIELDSIEASEAVVVVVNGETFDIIPEYFNEPIGVFIKESYDRKAETHLVEYLKKKYEGYQGVPVEYLNDELLLEDTNQVKTFLTTHYGKKYIQFVDFELVADYIFTKDVA
ncbi:hypothetical protein N9X61_01240 [Sulfurimonas sp.]|nr:hypothetical protein [Sulfurimonas sp.]